MGLTGCRPSTPYQKFFFDIERVSNDSSYPSLPNVDILYTMRQFDGQLVLDCLKNGAKGIVM
jgi:L-asparaginase